MLRLYILFSWTLYSRGCQFSTLDLQAWDTDWCAAYVRGAKDGSVPVAHHHVFAISETIRARLCLERQYYISLAFTSNNPVPLAYLLPSPSRPFQAPPEA
jgi:hypothetical protein